MPESAIEKSSGPSLEQILWRAMDRWEERPALVDSDEFAAHIEGVFQGDLPAERWVARFFDGAEGAKHEGPSDLAEAIVRTTRDRLAVYEFNLRKLEYVIVESEEKVVVVSDFGQFALRNDDMVSRAIEAAVIPAGGPLQRGGGEPKAYLVRSSGQVVAVDVKKVARSLEQLLVRQVSMPAVSKPAARMLPFAPSRRTLTEAREAQALRQDARTRQAVPAPPRLDRGAEVRPPGAQTALFLLMPDGTLARPEMGSATRWRKMVGQGQRLTVQAGSVVANLHHVGSPGTVGERALARSEGISAVRADSAPIRTLGDDALARALAAGAMVVPGLSRANQFWIQPEAAFKPGELGQGAAKSPAVVVQPLRLGEITGDPWADWALTGGGELSPEAMMALRGRSKQALRATLDRDAGKELQLAGASVVGFRAPDGSVVMQRGRGAVRLAALDRPDAIDLPLPSTGARIAARSGAIPATALAALQMALEQTANAGGYKLPMLRLASAPDAQDVGAAMDLASLDPRRTSVRLAGPTSRYDGSGQVAQLVLSMPFPNGGEVHVGDDLSEALQAYLGNAIQPAAGGAGGSLFAPMAAGAGPGMMLRLRGVASGDGSPLDLPILLQRALAEAGDWIPGSGAAVPVSIREFAVRGPFEPEFVSMAPQMRPLNPGEEEIVIPMPLWTQMGRGQLSETDQIMSSPLAPSGYTPPMGVYRLGVPGGGPVDLTAGAPAGTPGMVDLAGPTGLEIVARANGSGVQASSLGGRQFLGRVPMDDGESMVSRRGRIRIGAPLADGATGFQSSDSMLSQGGTAPEAGPAVVSGAQFPGIPDAPAGTYIDGTYRGSSALPTTGGSDQTLVVGAQVGSAAAEMASAASAALRGSASSPPFVTGLQPGMWSGHRRSDTSGYQGWSYSGGRDDLQRRASGVDLGSLSRPVYPSLPTALRFRYVGAPLWWSGSTRSGWRGDGFEASDSAPAGRAMRAGIRAATSAASIWRSILVSGPQWDGPAEDLSGGMDSGQDRNAAAMSSLSRHFDALTAAALVSGSAVGAGAGGAAYVAVNGSGAAGTVSRAAAQRRRLDSIEMSIVAAIPPAPPPLESMGSGATGGDAPRARGKGHGHGGQGQQKEAEEAVSHSKIEGSVDAIAQRIYHRIRRRIQSDRERFGG